MDWEYPVEAPTTVHRAHTRHVPHTHITYVHIGIPMYRPMLCALQQHHAHTYG